MRGLKTAAAASALALTLTAAPGAAPGHPHAWIDVVSTVVFDAEGRVAALETGWLFDPFYSVYVLEGFAEEGGDTESALRALAEANLKQLREYDYFLDVRADGFPQVLNDAENFETGFTPDQRLRLKFRVPLAAPVDPAAAVMTFSVYDPTYYIEILHTGDETPVVFSGPAPAACRAGIAPPDPGEEAASLAASLDKLASAPQDLGRLFAEIVTVKCG